MLIRQKKKKGRTDNSKRNTQPLCKKASKPYISTVRNFYLITFFFSYEK